MCLCPRYFGQTLATPLRHCPVPNVQALIVEVPPQQLQVDLGPLESWWQRSLCLQPSSSWCFSAFPTETYSGAWKCSDIARREHLTFPWLFLCLPHVTLYGPRLHPRSTTLPSPFPSCTPSVDLHPGVLPPHYPHRLSSHVIQQGHPSLPNDKVGGSF